MEGKQQEDPEQHLVRGAACAQAGQRRDAQQQDQRDADVQDADAGDQLGLHEIKPGKRSKQGQRQRHQRAGIDARTDARQHATQHQHGAAQVERTGDGGVAAAVARLPDDLQGDGNRVQQIAGT
ncbi:hypothetical protein D3C72_1780900 [compost metagenome]